MRETDLPSPNVGGKGFHLRRIAAAAVSQFEVSAAGYTNGVHPESQTLANFFTSAADFAAADGLLTPQATATPNNKTYSVAAGATAGPTVSAGGSAGAVSYTSSNTGVATVNSGTGAVTGVAPGTCWIIVAIAATATYRAWTFRYKAVVTA
jgi:hypothetical protein